MIGVSYLVNTKQTFCNNRRGKNSVMEEKGNFVKIYKDFMEDSETYSYREQFVYLLLKGNENSLNGASTVDVEQLISIMGLSSHSKNRKAMHDILLSLEDKKLLLLYSDMMLTKVISASNIKLTTVYYARMEKTSNESRGFTKIYNRDILKLMSMEEKSKDLMFAIYYNIIKRIFETVSSNDYSFVTIETIEWETGINRKTVMSKIAIMMEHKVLFCLKVNEGAEKDKNYYVRWDDRQLLIDKMKIK